MRVLVNASHRVGELGECLTPRNVPGLTSLPRNRSGAAYNITALLIGMSKYLITCMSSHYGWRAHMRAHMRAAILTFLRTADDEPSLNR